MKVVKCVFEGLGSNVVQRVSTREAQRMRSADAGGAGKLSCDPNRSAPGRRSVEIHSFRALFLWAVIEPPSGEVKRRCGPRRAGFLMSVVRLSPAPAPIRAVSKLGDAPHVFRNRKPQEPGAPSNGRTAKWPPSPATSNPAPCSQNVICITRS